MRASLAEMADQPRPLKPGDGQLLSGDGITLPLRMISDLGLALFGGIPVPLQLRSLAG